MIRTLFQLRSPGGQQGRLSVLIFHRVAPRPDPLFPAEVHAEQFDEICQWVRHWAHVLPLDEAVRRLREGTLPARALSISFDDGYADNHDVALPILLKHGLPATFFVSTGYLSGTCMWNDIVIEAIRACTHTELRLDECLGADFGRLPNSGVADKREAIALVLKGLKYLPADVRAAQVHALARGLGAEVATGLMMTPDQVRAMRKAGMQIGAHTVTHPILARASEAEVAHEIEESKRRLEALLDERVGLFAYPNGKPGEDYNEQSVAAVRRAGFDAAFSTRWAAASGATDLFELPRFTPWDRGRLKFGLRLVANLSRSPV